MPSRFTGWLGVVAILAWLFLLDDEYTGFESACILFISIFLPMACVELFILRRQQKGIFLPLRRKCNWSRVAVKLVGVLITVFVAACLYFSFPEYSRDFYDPFYDMLYVGWPLVGCCALYSVICMDRRMAEPKDVYYRIGLSFLRFSPEVSRKELTQHALQWTVKFFFIPLMWVYLVEYCEHDFRFQGDFSQVFEDLYMLIYTVDIAFVCVGYITASRLLNSHIRSAEPTTAGWLSALVCYQPFWMLVGGSYIMYSYSPTWGEWLQGYPAIYACWGCLILASLAVYVWATICFGIRFSNLTHRGIIDYGPYAWTRHPAYIAKLISFLLIQVPWAAESSAAAFKGLVLWSLLAGIYYVRAKTEERHLRSVDPTYSDYEARLAARQQAWKHQFLRMVGCRQAS